MFVAFATLFITRFDKIITADSPDSHNLVKSVHFIQINFVNCPGNLYLLCWHYPQCFCFPIMLKIVLA